MNTGTNTQTNLLTQWAQHIVHIARSSLLTTNPCHISKVETIAGSRAGALEMMCGIHAGDMVKSLAKNDAAVLRQFIPWDFVGDPQVFMRNRYVRVEAGWPSHLSDTNVKLSSLNTRSKDSTRWAIGKSETGATISASLNDRTAHYLISGTTGAGKSVAFHSAAVQLSRHPQNKLVLVDGKMGDSLHEIEHLPSVVAPCATEGDEIRNALGWAVKETMHRCRNHERNSNSLIVMIDEFQELVYDPIVVGLIKKLVSLGRSTNVHCLLATQHPSVKTFGDEAIKRLLVGKLALLVTDADASKVAVGGSYPRADRLLGEGDGYIVVPGACHRVQTVLIDEHDIDATMNLRGGRQDYLFDEFPEYCAENNGQDIETVKWHYTGNELGSSVISASEGDGRPALQDRLDSYGLGKPGSVRANRLLKMGRSAYELIQDRGYHLMKTE